MKRRPVVLVTGLSGAGRSSILRVLEDLGYEAVDNPPITLIEELACRAEGPVAIGIDARSRGFDAAATLAALERLRQMETLAPELVFAFAEEGSLLRRFTETRRRHPLAPEGPVTDGITRETAITLPLRAAADLVIDTSDTALPALRRLVEARFAAPHSSHRSLTVSLLSFGYPRGLPKEADLVFDARFLRNPHYDPHLRARTGMDSEVAAYVEADPDFSRFFEQIVAMLRLLLPRFVQEGKKYVTIAVGCTGGRHRSVRIVEKLAIQLRLAGCPQPTGLDMPAWQVTVAHRELQKAEASHPSMQYAGSVQAQEA